MRKFDWPKAGDKLIFDKVPEVFYPHFINVGKYASDNLIAGQEYTVAKCEVYSSWCAVWLEGHGDNFFNLSFFKDWRRFGR